MFFNWQITTNPRLAAITSRLRLRFSDCFPRAVFLAVLSSLVISRPASLAAEALGWDFQPYRIQAALAIDLPGGLVEEMSEEIPRYLDERARSAIGPLWSFDVKVVAGVTRQLVLTQVATLSAAPPADLPAGGDKLLLLVVRGTPGGYELIAREYDRFIERWGMPVRGECGQLQSLPEHFFALVWQAVAPLAQFEVDPNDANRVLLKPRGGALPRGSGTPSWAESGDVFLPILRRTSRGGALVDDGIRPVPWTYIEALQNEDGTIVGRVHSASRRPFGARRQGRVEQLAIGLRADPAPTIVRFHSRTTAEKPLVGYEVYAQNAGEDALTRVGVSDRHGTLSISPGKTRVQFLLVKSGGQLLAKLPIVPGADAEVAVPLPDDDVRLVAEARLAALREDLIDVVARRNILMARARQKIEKRDYDAAQEMLRALDELPGRSQFNLTLTTTARQFRSNDPQIQRRIDQLFQATQTLLTQFLDVRPINQLHDELRAARQKKT